MTPAQPNNRHHPTGPPPPEDGANPTTPGFTHHALNHPGDSSSNQAVASPPGFTATTGDPHPKKKQMNPWLAGGIGVLVGSFGTVAALSVVGLAGSTAAVNLIEDTVVACGDPQGITVADEGKSLLFDTEGDEDFSGASLADVACVFAGIEVPEHVIDQMSRTSALAGNQNATWDDFEAQWTYHPDRGLDGVIRVVE